jgi:UDP-N-acetylmuramoyl-L-alanyl-D-glutamate--2,6-diaminopimelate ligase
VLSPDHTTFTLVLPGAAVPVRSSLIGRFNVLNTLAAGATAYVAGIDAGAIARGVQRPIAVPGRMERVDAGQPFPVFVDYAHTPDALAAVL